MERPQVKNYTHSREFLLAYFNFQKSINPKFSILLWSRQLGFNSPGYLSNVLKGRRKLKKPFIDKLSNQMNMSRSETEMLILLSKINDAENPGESEIYGKILDKMFPRFAYQKIELEKFRLIRDWYHLPLLQMFDLADWSSPDFVECIIV